MARAQSPIGFLVQVHDRRDGEGLKPRVTEILFYGTIAIAPPIEGLPTPPSSQDIPNARPGLLPELHVHAIPLSSDLLHHKTASSILPTLPTAGISNESGEIDAQFLPSLRDCHTAPNSPKRKRDLFEEATLAKRKAKSKGGESVAAAAARATESQRPYAHRKSVSAESKASSFPDPRPQSGQGASSFSSRQLSRSPSIASDIRPLSRRDTAEPHSRRSHLSQVDTITPEHKDPTTESRNKEALAKVVMAAMRMHGLQQRKKTKSRHVSMAFGLEESQSIFDETVAEDATKDEEFKLIYHQTYKGAALALVRITVITLCSSSLTIAQRKHMTEKPLHAQPDRMRDLVEQFLMLFLTDPLAQPPPSDEPTNSVATPGVKQVGIFASSQHQASPFDLPSGMRRPPMMRSQTDSQVYTGSPVSKRKTSNHKLGDV